MIYFTADLHMGHKKILEYENRPFPSTHEMNLSLVERWNDVVSPVDPSSDLNDAVFHIGDFSMNGKWDLYMPLLNGYKTLILGNHDKAKFYKNFPIVGDNMYDIAGEEVEIVANKYIHSTRHGVSIFMHHHPVFLTEDDRGRSIYRPKDVMDQYNSCDIFLYGHVHSKIPKGSPAKAICVSCENWDYSPVSLDKIVEVYKERIKK